MSSLRAWHRWLAVEGEGARWPARSPAGRTSSSCSSSSPGAYLWLPRVWRWQNVRSVLFFRRQAARQGARLQLAQRHRRLVGRPAVHRRHQRRADLVSVGQRARLSRRRRGAARGRARRRRPRGRAACSGPARRCSPGRAPRAAERQRDRRASVSGCREAAAARTRDAVALDGLNSLWTRAEQHVPGWRTINLRIPTSDRAPVVFAIDRGDGGPAASALDADAGPRLGRRRQRRELLQPDAGPPHPQHHALRPHR